MSQDRTQAFVYMKAGHHADEPLEKILERKNREFDAEQRIFWGYGGTLAHPRTQVQPFAKLWARHGNQVQLLMAVTQSKHYSDSPRATEYSVDGEIWKQIPKGISVTGSKHALVIGPLEPVDFELDISEYEVGIGPKENTNAAQYPPLSDRQGLLQKGAKSPNRKPRHPNNQTPGPTPGTIRRPGPLKVQIRPNPAGKSADTMKRLDEIGQYATVVTDPPWDFTDFHPYGGGVHRTEYSSLPTSFITDMPIEDILLPDANVFLWTTQRSLTKALGMVEDRKLTYRFTMVWHKPGGSNSQAGPQAMRNSSWLRATGPRVGWRQRPSEQQTTGHGGNTARNRRASMTCSDE